MAAFTEQQKTEFSMQKWYDLSGKTAVVTGGITGLGLAITRCLVSAGAKVIALSRTDEKKGNEILKEFGGKAVFYQFDITDTDHAQELRELNEERKNMTDTEAKKAIEMVEGTDLFEGVFSGLTLAEVEFESIEEANAYIPPSWFTKDVTMDAAYHNSNMSKKVVTKP